MVCVCVNVCVCVCVCVCVVYLVVVPEPFSVSQSWRGGVTGNLQNNKSIFKCMFFVLETSTLEINMISRKE